MKIQDKIYALKYGKICWDYSWDVNPLKSKTNKMIFIVELNVEEDKDGWHYILEDNSVIHIKEYNKEIHKGIRVLITENKIQNQIDDSNQKEKKKLKKLKLKKK